MAELNNSQMLRYSRHIMLPEFGYSGQEKLTQSHVLIIGIGGLGAPAALYLASSGIGTLTLVDDDQVELSNLQRQIIHNNDTIGQNKVDSGASALQKINPEITIHTLAQRLIGDALHKACNNADIVLDCTDRFASRFAINAACVQTQTPLVSAAAIRFDGQLSSYDMQGEKPCYQCLYPEQGEEELRCSENGILAPVVGTMGILQALETIKMLTDIGETLNGKLLVFDGLRTEFRTITINKDPDCPVCNPKELVDL